MKTHTTTHPLRTAFDRASLTGPTVVAGETGWDAARQAWNLTVDQHPRAVVFPETVADVMATVEIAAATGHRIVTQGTGHGATGYSSLEDCILIRTTRLQKLLIEKNRCTAGAGVLWGDVSVAAGATGQAGLGGSSPDVGVIGYSLGGGIGWLSRPYGLASSLVREIEIVTADGVLRRAAEDENAEMFWALRGGGGGLGIVTGISFDLVPIATVYAGTLAWDAAEAPEILPAWADWTDTIGEEITSIIRFLNLPEAPGVPEVFAGRRVLTLGMAAVGDHTAAERVIQRMREVGSPILDTVGQMPAATLCRLHGDPEGPTPGLANHTLLSSLDDSAITRLIEVAGVESGSSLVSVEIRHLGGALNRIPDNAGALSHVSAPYVLNAVGAAYSSAQAVDSFAELSAVVAAMNPWSDGQYLNFVERPGKGVFTPDAQQRLARIRASVDPDGLFYLRSGIAG